MEGIKVTTQYNRKKTFLCKSAVSLLFLIITLLFSTRTIYAENTSIDVLGKCYSFTDDKNNYQYSEEEKYTTASPGINTYGKFTIDGDIVNTSEIDGIPAYSVGTDNLSFYYMYDDTLLNASEEEWHLVEDKGKQVDAISLTDKIKKGALILQTSKDRKIWIDEKILTNAFEDTPLNDESLYTTNDVQLNNGCYYRLIVAYKTGIKTGSGHVAFVIPTNEYSYQKNIEVYEFYLSSAEAVNNTDSSKKEKVNGNDSMVRTKAKGYDGEQKIKYDDPHYGWSIGDFFVSGYTGKATDEDKVPVFLKNVDDQVTFWFKLNYDIKALNGDDAKSIVDDKDGYDYYFGTAKQDFGRGALIIRHTTYEQTSPSPVIYRNYLEANASAGADTKVELLEEGDYEVALDYKIQYNKTKILGKPVLPEESHYRVFFKFKIRNGNCMVFPIELGTNAELTNESITENGFYLDLAKSRYLTVMVKKEVLNSGANGLVEDTRFNRPAEDGEKYTDEGIYTITVSNIYTGVQTTKKIYVGTDKILKAYAVTGESLERIQEQLSDGATISDDGKIIPPADKTLVQTTATVSTESVNTADSNESPALSTTDALTESGSDKTSETAQENNSAKTSKDELSENDTTTKSDKKASTAFIPIIGVVVLAVLVIGVMRLKKKTRRDQ